MNLTIDDDVFAAAAELALAEHKSVGEVISALARRALQPSATGWEMRDGIPLLPARAGSRQVTSAFVEQMLDELP